MAQTQLRRCNRHEQSLSLAASVYLDFVQDENAFVRRQHVEVVGDALGFGADVGGEVVGVHELIEVIALSRSSFGILERRASKNFHCHC